jgi:hypothetical protein
VLQLLLACLATAGVAASGQVPLAAKNPGQANRAAWIALKDAGFAVPAGASPAAILDASAGLLGNRDPILRDEVAYGLAVAWMYKDRRVPDEVIRAFAARLRQNLRPGPPGDAALERSFSALVLSVVAAADLKAPFFTPADRAALVHDASVFLVNELDTRGYDPQVGWVHATAHTADLLKFLARSPQLTATDQRTIVQAIAARIDRPGGVFTWGEDGRLAAALGALVVRPDFDRAPLDAWLGGLTPAWKALWSAPALDMGSFARLTNARHVLQSVAVSTARTEDLPEGARAIRARILDVLGELD